MVRIGFIGKGPFGMNIRNYEMNNKLSSFGETLINISEIKKLDHVKNCILTPLVKFKHKYIRQPYKKIVNAVDQDLFHLRIEKILNQNKKYWENIDVMHAEGSHYGFMSHLISEKIGVPYVLDLHGLWGEEHRGEYGEDSALMSEYLSQLEKIALSNAVHVITVSKKMSDYIVSKHRISRQKITEIRNGGFISKQVATFSPRPSIIYGGILSYWENVQDYVKLASFSECKDLDFILVGDGPKKEEILDTIEKNKVANIRYLGRKPRKKTLKLFYNSQIGIAPSTSDIVRQVAWPIKVMDYMSCGLPVIAPNIGEWSEFIDKNEAGIVTKQNSPEDFVEAVERLHNEKYWKTRSKNALHTIQEQYTWDKVLEPLETIYAQFIK